MKLLELKASRYGSLKNETIAFGPFNVLIGANASGKSTIVDALRFMHDGLRDGDFIRAVGRRGGPRYLFGKWDKDAQARLSLLFEDFAANMRYRWSITLAVEQRRFSVNEEVVGVAPDDGEIRLLSVKGGSGWWMSGADQKVHIEQGSTTCALANASADTAFNARVLNKFVSDWRFIDPNLFAIRRGRQSNGLERLTADGSNLLERLYRLKETSPKVFDKIFEATKSTLGMPEALSPVLHSDEDGHDHYHLHFEEKGLNSPVTQNSASSGTLRILTLMTALLENMGSGFVSVEEPENNIHPSALGDFLQHLIDASHTKQLLITTHSPILLNSLKDPGAVRIVRRDAANGTRVFEESDPNAVADALEASGFALGEFHETKGFGR